LLALSRYFYLALCKQSLRRRVHDHAFVGGKPQAKMARESTKSAILARTRLRCSPALSYDLLLAVTMHKAKPSATSDRDQCPAQF
jgi:hypothetical protein